jgi:hypothetical protein
MQPARHTITVHGLLIASVRLFLLGVFAPLMTVKKWLLFAHPFSLVAGLTQLVQAGHYVLFLLVMTFSLLLPLVKTSLVAVVYSTAARAPASTRRMLHWLSLCGKWSMIERKITIVENNARYLVTGAPLSTFDLNGILAYLSIQRVPGSIIKRMRVTLPQRKALTLCKWSEHEWFILYPPKA